VRMSDRIMRAPLQSSSAGLWIGILAVLATTAPGIAQPVNYDTIIKNGRIIDGTGAAWYRGDVAIAGGKIAALGVLDVNSTASQVIDAADQYVAPGFIDVHAHCEGDFDNQPQAENFLRMGVTTVVTGNCGGSYLNLGDALTSLTSLPLGVNVGSFIGHNTVRRNVMGNEDRDPSTTEILEMRRLVSQAMTDGAVGMSTGLIYTPGTYSKTPEIIALAEEVAKANGIYVSHMRSEGDRVTSAIEEALTIGREAGLPVHISHFKITSPKRHGESSVTLGMVEAARQAGQDVTVDQYAYTASSTTIRTMVATEFVEGTSEEIQARMTDPTTRSLVIKDIVDSYRGSGRENLNHARVASFRPDPSINGMSIYEIAKKWKGSDTWEAQAEVIVDIITSGSAGMVFHSLDEKDVQNIMLYPHTMVASDSGIRTMGQGKPHPRGYGNNARVLALYTRDLKVLRLEDAVRKMTSLPARTMRFMDRGVLRPGMAADVVVFDFEKVQDPATFEQPHAYAEGFTHVLVNGKPTIINGELTAERGGQVIYGPAKSTSVAVAGAQ
jgi:N-acyl-D-amino-acid deacylase